MSTEEVKELSAAEMEALGQWAAKFRADYAGSIYAIQAGDFIKIGFTKRNVFERMAKLQTGCPMPIALLGTGPGGRYIERGVHSLLKEFRIRGEWFRDHPLVHQTINQFCTARA